MSHSVSIVQYAIVTCLGELGYAVGNSPHQTRTFATLCETLLPKLLSGELSVANAAEVIHNLER